MRWCILVSSNKNNLYFYGQGKQCSTEKSEEAQEGQEEVDFKTTTRTWLFCFRVRYEIFTERFTSRASAILRRNDNVGFSDPDSKREMADCFVPIFFASSD